jgi:hypothetical protein
MGRELRFTIPAGTPVKACKSCGAGIYWIRTAAGKAMPCDPDGTSHFASCPQADQHRKRHT